jgi:hypothetical protein
VFVAAALVACHRSGVGSPDEDLAAERTAAGLLAVRLTPPPQRADAESCGDLCPKTLAGRYALRADSCYQWGDRLARGYLIAKLPDFSRLPGEALVLEVREISTDSLYEFRLQRADGSTQHSFTVPKRSRGDPAVCAGCIVYRDFRSRGNMGGFGGFFWTMGRTGRGALSYGIAFESRPGGILPGRRLRQMQCTFPAVASEPGSAGTGGPAQPAVGL